MDRNRCREGIVEAKDANRRERHDECVGYEYLHRRLPVAKLHVVNVDSQTDALVDGRSGNEDIRIAQAECRVGRNDHLLHDTVCSIAEGQHEHKTTDDAQDGLLRLHFFVLADDGRAG